MTLRNPGVLLGLVNDVYSEICSKMIDERYSIVGIYYYRDGSINILFYRIFDGTIYPFLNDEMTFDQLLSHPLINSLERYEFNQEGWLLDGNLDQLNDRVRLVINRSIINISPPDYRNLILGYTNLVDGPIMNGYYRINEIIKSVVNGQNYNSHHNIIDCKYLKDPIKLTKLPNNKFIDEATIIESKRRLTDLSSTIIDLIFENPKYKDHLTNFNAKIFSYNPIVINDQLITKELEMLKTIIEQLASSFETGKQPIISISKLIEIYNQMASKNDLPLLTIKNKTNFESVGALLVANPSNINIDRISINLRSGEIIHISCTGDGLEKLSSDQLLEVLRYVLSIRGATNSYNGLLDIITAHCVSKNV